MSIPLSRAAQRYRAITMITQEIPLRVNLVFISLLQLKALQDFSGGSWPVPCCRNVTPGKLNLSPWLHGLPAPLRFVDGLQIMRHQCFAEGNDVMNRSGIVNQPRRQHSTAIPQEK